MAVDPNFALYPQTRTEIPLLRGKVDGYPTEEHRLELGTTEYPVESGSSLTDNAVKKPEKLRLTGWVSDLLPAPGSEPGPIKQRAAKTWQNLIQIFEDRMPVSVITPLRVYRNMLITSASAPVNVNTGRSLRFTLELKEVLFADTELTRFPPGRVNPNGPAVDRTSTVDGGDRVSSPTPVLPLWFNF